jgi:hypothetical protein
MSLYEKRGRNTKGQVMFHGMGGGGQGGSDIGVPIQNNSLNMH